MAIGACRLEAALTPPAAGLAKDERCQSAAGQHSGYWTHYRDCNCHDGCGPEGLSLGTGVCRLARLGAAAEFNQRENPAGRDHEMRGLGPPIDGPAKSVVSARHSYMSRALRFGAPRRSVGI